MQAAQQHVSAIVRWTDYWYHLCVAFTNSGARSDSTYKHTLRQSWLHLLEEPMTGGGTVALKHVTNTFHPITASGLDGIENDNKEGTWLLPNAFPIRNFFLFTPPHPRKWILPAPLQTRKADQSPLQSLEGLIGLAAVAGVCWVSKLRRYASVAKRIPTWLSKDTRTRIKFRHPECGCSIFPETSGQTHYMTRCNSPEDHHLTNL
jgi:hypothetical protein